MPTQPSIEAHPEYDKYNDKKVRALWFDDPNWYEGVVEKLEDGMHMVRSKDLGNDGLFGLLECAYDFDYA